MLTKGKIKKAIGLGAKIDYNFEAELIKITKEIVRLVEKSSAPNLITEEIREAIEKNTFYCIREDNKYWLNNLEALASAC